MREVHAIAPPETPRQSALRAGFTLIEISIVLVIIGLIIGGVLVGQDLIRAAGVRATISQIEKYNQAANTFLGKYGGLPGDLPAPLASQFGFTPRGIVPGEGDGNGILEGWNGSHLGNILGCGETATFWVDLSFANGQNVNLIDQSFSTATETSNCAGANVTGSGLSAYFPTAKLGGGNYIYVWSSNATNYFGIGATSQLTMSGGGAAVENLGLTVQQAYAIDSKIDDGFPLTGNVTTYVIGPGGSVNWAPLWTGNPSSYTIYGSSATCYDNSGNASNPMQYSLGQNNGAGINCALSFKMQAGD